MTYIKHNVRDSFAIFILTHGRADKVLTIDTLKKCGYTGKVYYICDNEDSQLDKYYENFGRENVIVFDKLAKSKEFDTMDLLDRDRRAIVYARNASFDIAKNLGLTYFLELDDDYTEFRTRYVKDGQLKSIYVGDLDSIIEETLNFLDVSGALTVAFSQTGDFIGGMDSAMFKSRIRRKAMNSFFCRVDRKFDFIGRVNEDVNTYTSVAHRGGLFMTIADISLNQQDSQQHSGGMSELYLDSGTYVKSFFTVIACPSAVKVYEMGVGHKRLHHLIDWDKCAPKIISSKFRNY